MNHLATGIEEIGLGLGFDTLLLAEFARFSRIEADPALLAAWAARLEGAAEDERARWAEALALEEMILSAPEHFVPDGPSRVEGAAPRAAKK